MSPDSIPPAKDDHPSDAADSGGVLVFGGYGGVGSALSQALVASGVRVVLAGRDPTRLAALTAELGPLASHCVADARDFEAVTQAVEASVAALGRLDGVANCVGSLLLKPAHLTRREEWDTTIHTNLTTAFAVLRASAAVMSKQPCGGSIVLVSTAASAIGLANHEAIAAAKGGIDALVRSAAATYGRRHVRVNAVAPGLVATPLTERITSNERARASSEAMHALGRLGTPPDVASAMAWLLSGESSWVTGQTIGVDGGLGAVRSA